SATCEPGKNRTWIITSLAFTREKNGVAPGFDLDHVDNSTDLDDRSCGKKDLVAPDGTRGIDNQLSLVIPVVEQQFGNAVDGIVQGAINDGRLLIALNVANVHDIQNDQCVDMNVVLAQGKPSLGTDGIVEAYQTFDPRADGQYTSVAHGGKITNGTMEIGP